MKKSVLAKKEGNKHSSSQIILIVVLVGTFFTRTTSAAAPVPNELGKIPIFVYHQIGERETRWQRSYTNFQNDLLWLYHNDYRTVSMTDFTLGRINLPLGKKPVILTFDDGLPSQLTIKNGVVSETSAVGIMDAFLKVYPDFGPHAVFYINQHPFSTSDSEKVALSYLINTGREIGNHTEHHADISKLDFPDIEKEIWGLKQHIYSLGLPPFSFNTVAYPYGLIADQVRLQSVDKWASFGLLVGAEPAVTIYDARFDAMHIPRIQPIDSEWKHWFRRPKGSTAFETNSEIYLPYRSDGEKSTLTVRSKKYLRSDIPGNLTIIEQ